MKTRVAVAGLLALLVVCGSPREPVSARALPEQGGSVDQLVAPIALYPDQLLAQIFLCAQTPDKVTELDAWLKANQSLKGTQLQDAAVKAGFEPSLVALVLFPDVVKKMAGDIKWTTLLGQTFMLDR